MADSSNASFTTADHYLGAARSPIAATDPPLLIRLTPALQHLTGAARAALRQAPGAASSTATTADEPGHADGPAALPDALAGLGFEVVPTTFTKR